MNDKPEIKFYLRYRSPNGGISESYIPIEERQVYEQQKRHIRDMGGVILEDKDPEKRETGYSMLAE